jgi:WD40 repeat protein
VSYSKIVTDGAHDRWDALGPSAEKVKDEDDTSGAKTEEDGEDVTEGRIWRLQAHARNSITAMKIDPVNGSGVSLPRACESKTNNQLFSSSYDCTLRHLDFSTLKSTELFAHSNDDMLITHFDLMPSGQQAWLADKNGGISFCDFREGQQERRRWVVQEEGRAAKLGGLSINRASSSTILVTGADPQHYNPTCF